MSAKTYKAAIYRSAGNVEVIEKPYPKCGDDDIIVKNRISGICGSDLSAWRKDGDPHMIWKDHEFGHEMVSEVAEKGKNVKDLEVGDLVFPLWGYAYRDRNRSATVGGFSEYIHIKQHEANVTDMKLDNNVPLKAAALIEPFQVGLRGAKGLGPEPGKTAIVFGAGIIGMSAAIAMKWYGCDKVMVVDISDFRLKQAQSYGLLICNPDKEDLKAKAIEEFGVERNYLGECCGADLYVDCLGIPPAIEYFQMLAKRDAMLAIVGVHHKPVSFDMVALCYCNWKIQGGSSIPLHDGLSEVLKLVKSGEYDITKLISHEYPLDKIADALTMSGNAREAHKVAISYPPHQH